MLFNFEFRFNESLDVKDIKTPGAWKKFKAGQTFFTSIP